MIKRHLQAVGHLVVLSLAATFAATGCSSRTAGGSDIEISSVYIAEPVMGERAALYFTLTNRASIADDLMAVSTPIAEMAEIHRTIADGGMMRMEPVESLRVSPGETLHLAPGGYHVMLLNLTRQIEPGDIVEVTLTFRRTGALSSRARVIALPKLEGVLDSATDGDHHH